MRVSGTTAGRVDGRSAQQKHCLRPISQPIRKETDMTANTTRPLQTAHLDATPRTDEAGNPLTRFTLTLNAL